MMNVYIAFEPFAFTKLLAGQFNGLVKVRSSNGFSFWVESDQVIDFERVMARRFPSYLLADKFVQREESNLIYALTGVSD